MNEDEKTYCPLSPDELRFLAESGDFQNLIENDAELDRLESLQYDEQAERSALYETLFRPCGKIGSLPVMPLTPACWSLLWCISSPYVCGDDVRLPDIEHFLFLLSFDFRTGALLPEELPHKSAGICRRAGLPPGIVHEKLLNCIRTAFLPLSLLPAVGKDIHPTARFDAEWLNRLCATASCRTNTPIHSVIREMSLNQVCWHYVNMLRERDRSHTIRRRPEAEIARGIMNRIYSIGKEFLEKQKNRSIGKR